MNLRNSFFTRSVLFICLLLAGSLTLTLLLQPVSKTAEAAVMNCYSAPQGMTNWWRAEFNGVDLFTGLHATVNASYDTGKVGSGAFSFNGTNQDVNLGNGYNFDAFTIEAWVFIDPATNTGERRVISKDNVNLAGTRKLFTLKSSSPAVAGNQGRAAFAVLIGGNLDAIEASSPLTAGWHHLAGVRDTANGIFRLYVDGFQAASKVPTVIGAIDSVVPTMLGKVSPTFNDEYFSGRIDEVSFYNRALLPGEILSIFQADTAGKCVTGLTDLSITKQASLTAANFGDSYNYTLTITNHSTVAAQGVKVTDNLPAELSLIGTPTATGGGVFNISGNQIMVTYPTLAAGASQTIILPVKVTGCLIHSDTISNTASVSALTAEESYYNNSSTSSILYCDLITLTPSSVNIPAAGGGGTINVTSGSGCPWTATTPFAWITITGGSGTGSGSFTYTVAPNAGGQRVGGIIVNGFTVTVIQAAFSATPTPTPALPYTAGGRVTNAARTAGIPGVTMTFTRVSGTGAVPPPVVTNASGFWSQSGFVPGTTYRVRPTKSGATFRLAYQDFNRATTNLNFYQN